MMGQVPDVRTPLRRAGIFICPILTGSGIRVKLLEAFASEIAVVSTTLGAEGLASESGLVCELADTPEAFAKSILVLLENKHYRDELVERARLMVTKERDSHSAIARLERSYRGEVSQVRPPARDKPLQLS
jgi:glycosyltransferase involved in cell wall biosynthesis